MKITKFGHCCLLIEVSGLRILTDPGMYSDSQNTVENIDMLLITHEHQDHLHIDSVKAILQENPATKVVTNSSVGAILEAERIAYTVVDDGKSTTEGSVLIEGFGKEHAIIYKNYKQVENTGYRIAEALYYHGDAFHNPGVPVEILALPVAGPWMKLAEAIDFSLEVKPRVCFPVHDGMLKIFGPAHALPKAMLEPAGIKFEVLELNKASEL